jgi:hypothetical protein
MTGAALPHIILHCPCHLIVDSSAWATSAPISSNPSCSEVQRSSLAPRKSTLPPSCTLAQADSLVPHRLSERSKCWCTFTETLPSPMASGPPHRLDAWLLPRAHALRCAASRVGCRARPLGPIGLAFTAGFRSTGPRPWAKSQHVTVPWVFIYSNTLSNYVSRNSCKFPKFIENHRNITEMEDKFCIIPHEYIYTSELTKPLFVHHCIK